MLAKDMIAKLEQMIKDHEPAKEMMGELEIMIDCFQERNAGTGFNYKGFSPNIEFQLTEDSVYWVLAAKETWEHDKKSNDQELSENQKDNDQVR